MAGIIHQGFILEFLAVVFLLCPYYVCTASLDPCHKNCDCSPSARTDNNSEYSENCTCPEYGIIPEDIRSVVLRLELYYSYPVVLRNGNIQKFSQIRFLNISGMQFVEPGGFQGLETLDTLVLHENYMRVLETAAFAELTKLTKLKVEGTTKSKIHALENGTFLGLKKMKHLYLTDNAIIEITEEHFRDLESLEILHLANNKLAQIEAYTFIHAPNLKQIILSNNLITEIHRNAFQSLTRLDSLALDGNRIKGMPQPVSFPGSLRFSPPVESNVRHVTISLDNNPLRCDCHLNWISSWLDHGQECEGSCLAPSKFNKQSLEHVYRDGLPQCQPNNTVLSVEPGKQLELTCSFARAAWVTPDGRSFQEHGDCEDPFYLTNSDSLVIWKTSPNISGNYTCHSSDGSEAFLYQVTVHGESNSPLSIATVAGIATGVFLVVVLTIVFSCKLRDKSNTRDPRLIDPPPASPVPGNSVSEDPVPENPVPENPVPENPVPENPVPENQVPENPVPENPVPENPVPENPAPGNPQPQDVANDRVPLLRRPDGRESPIAANSYEAILKKDSLSDKNVNINTSSSL